MSKSISTLVASAAVGSTITGEQTKHGVKSTLKAQILDNNNLLVCGQIEEPNGTVTNVNSAPGSLNNCEFIVKAGHYTTLQESMLISTLEAGLTGTISLSIDGCPLKV